MKIVIPCGTPLFRSRRYTDRFLESPDSSGRVRECDRSPRSSIGMAASSRSLMRFSFRTGVRTCCRSGGENRLSQSVINRAFGCAAAMVLLVGHDFSARILPDKSHPRACRRQAARKRGHRRLPVAPCSSALSMLSQTVPCAPPLSERDRSRRRSRRRGPLEICRKTMIRWRRYKNGMNWKKRVCGQALIPPDQIKNSMETV